MPACTDGGLMHLLVLDAFCPVSKGALNIKRAMQS